MNLRNRAWQYSTVVVVVLVLLNPEMIELALFIDAVGLEVFLMLFEIQLLAIMSAIFSNSVKPVVSGVRHLLKVAMLSSSVRKIREGTECLVVSVPIEAALMHLLVISAVIAGAFRVWQ